MHAPATDDKTNAAVEGSIASIRGLDGIMDRIASVELLARGCVNIIGIEALRDEMGARWLRARDNVYERVEKHIARQVGPADFFSRISDVEYIVSLPAEFRISAQLRCFRILQEILAVFLGQFSLEQIRVKAVTATDGGVLTCLPIDARSLGSAAAATETDVATPLGETPAPPTGVAAQVVKTIAPAGRPLSVEFEFHPIWDLRHSIMSSFSLSVHVRTEQSAAVGERRTARAQLAPEELAAIDIAGAEHGWHALQELFQRHCRFILHLPVSYETLASGKFRARYVQVAQRFTAELRRYIVFELSDLPAGVPQSRLQDLVAMLKPYGRGVIALSQLHRPALLALQGSGLIGVAADLQLYAGREPELFAKIELLSDLGRLAGDHLIAYGVATKSLAMACWALGLTHASGSAIAPNCAMPHHMLRFRPLDLYQL